VEQAALDGAIDAYVLEHGLERQSRHDSFGSDSDDAGALSAPSRKFTTSPGLQAFIGEFKQIFDIIWRERWTSGQVSVAGCKIGEDPELLLMRLECSASADAATVAGTVATVVAMVARAGERGRRAQSMEGMAAWDGVWTEESRQLIELWREQALAGKLELDPDSLSYQQRQVEKAVALAERASQEAMHQAQETLACGLSSRSCCCGTASEARPSIDQGSRPSVQPIASGGAGTA
jgi:hypothetical protein